MPARYAYRHRPSNQRHSRLGDEICRSTEAEVWGRGAEISHERLDILVSATGLVQ
jgi:hypothetical protein